MTSLFEKNLMRMKRELTDLKCAHQRGLGTIRFFQKSIDVKHTTLSTYTVKATIADGEPEWPLISCYAIGTIGAQGITDVRFESQTATTAIFSITSASDFTAVITSSSAIKELI
jgi:hypothetical protein